MKVQGSVLIALCVCILVSHSLAAVQVGRRFPLGVQLGGENVTCDGSADTEGLLRYHDEVVEVCRAGEWVPVGSNETLNVNEQIVDLRNRVEELEANPSSSTALLREMQESNYLANIQICSRHGVYNSSLRECQCDCSARLGCWEADTFCTTCTPGWYGPNCRGDSEAPEITIIGDNPLVHEGGNPYTDSGATAYDNKDLDVTSGIVVTNGVNAYAVGTYNVDYTVSDEANNTASATRVVSVVDTTKPVIHLYGPSVLTIEASDTFPDPFAYVTDNIDETYNISANVESINFRVVQTVTVVYDATDENENVADSVSRTVVIVDTTAPEIMLNGNTHTFHAEGETFVDPYVTTADNADGAISVEVDSNVAPGTAGDYTIEYSATDEAGNVAVPKTRYVHVRSVGLSCNSWISLNPQFNQTSIYSNGVYMVYADAGHTSTRNTVCRFEGGRGYDLLMNLDTGDSVSRNYRDTNWWTSPTSSVASVSSSATYASLLSSEFKGEQYSELQNLQEIILVGHNGETGGEYGSARYAVDCNYRSNTNSMLTFMTSYSNTRLTSRNLNAVANLPIPGAQDLFLERTEPLVVNRLSGFAQDTMLTRLCTTYEDTSNGHAFGGIGGEHYEGRNDNWQILYEYAPFEHYCSQNVGYGDSSLTGNYVDLGTHHFPFEDGCLVANPTFLPVDLAIFALSDSAPAPAPVIADCQSYFDNAVAAGTSGSLVDGPVTFSDGRSSYCMFDAGVGKGYDLLMNLNTRDTNSRHWYDGFWTSDLQFGSISNTTLKSEFKGSAYLSLSRMSELRIVYHTAGSIRGSARYTMKCDTYGESFRDIMTVSNNRVITSTKINANVDLQINNAEDLFLERTEALIANRHNFYAQDRSNARLSTTYDNTNNGHAFAGMGGDHLELRNNNWEIYYELAPFESYCSQNTGYGDPSSIGGNYVQPGSYNFPFQPDCASNVQWLPIDVAIFASVESSSSPYCSACA